MTFPEQIKGVPPELVAQGWRLKPNNTQFTDWLSTHDTARWHSMRIAHIRVYRPVVAHAANPVAITGIYAHQGWGDGLAPTPEMVKVWQWWWYDTNFISGGSPHLVVLHKDQMLWDRIANMPGNNPWLGPVLPPAGVV